MKVLILGSGGREHALAWAIARSPRVTEIVCAPGNGGMAQKFRCVPVDLNDVSAMVHLAESERPKLTVVGPELPLSLGIVDALRERDLRVFGPTRAAAMLESSKGFAKQFLERHKIPTPNYAVCSSAAEVEKAIDVFHPPIVVKADGLFAGKGVIICASRQTAAEAAQGLFSGALLGEAAQQIIIEEFLDTGGMGVYSTDTLLDPAMSKWILRHIAEPTINGMAEEGTPFTGVLYCGLMMTARGPQVLEFNARFGDPETQAILVRLNSDFIDALEACVDGRLAETPLNWSRGASACVVASSGGYPGSYKSGLPITGLSAADKVPGVEVFHAGTALKDGQMLTAGGRVLGVTAAADSLHEALARAYQAMAEIQFEGMYYRRDIGHRALNQKQAGKSAG
jgi:phosphoribosylamine--glycine ligase